MEARDKKYLAVKVTFEKTSDREERASHQEAGRQVLQSWLGTSNPFPVLSPAGS